MCTCISSVKCISIKKTKCVQIKNLFLIFTYCILIIRLIKYKVIIILMMAKMIIIAQITDILNLICNAK